MKKYPRTGNIQRFKNQEIPDSYTEPDRTSFWEGCRQERSMSLPNFMEGIPDGFDIRNSEGIHSRTGEILETREIGNNQYPNILQELRDLVEPFQAGPWEGTLNIHLPTFASQIQPNENGRVYSLPAALANAALRYEKLEETDFQRKQLILHFVRRAAEKGDRKTTTRCARIYNRVLLTPLVEPVKLSFDPVVENLGDMNDLVSRCAQDDTSYHIGHERYQTDLEKDCVCFDSAGKSLPYPELQRFRKREATERTARFYRLLFGIRFADKKRLAEMFRYNKNLDKTGLFYRKVEQARKRRKYAPEDCWLNADQQVVLTYQARKRLGWSISDSFMVIVRQATKRLTKGK